MKMTLSMPSTTSSTVSVTSAIRPSAVNRAVHGPNSGPADRGLCASPVFDAAVREPQPGDGLAADQVTIDDLVDVALR